MSTERLQKILSNAGIASRRDAEKMIVGNRVAVNGKIENILGSRANPVDDLITVDNIPISFQKYRYVALNKPPGVLTSARDDRGRKTVLDLLGKNDIKMHPVGRLDLESEGLILLTNDGQLTNLLTHPKHRVEKEYLVEIDRPLGKVQRLRLMRGIYEKGELLKATAVERARESNTSDSEEDRWLLITLQEGKNREIRRMMGEMKRRIQTLRRVRIGLLNLGTLKIGEFRNLSSDEIATLYAPFKGTENMQ